MSFLFLDAKAPPNNVEKQVTIAMRIALKFICSRARRRYANKPTPSKPRDYHPRIKLYPNQPNYRDIGRVYTGIRLYYA